MNIYVYVCAPGRLCKLVRLQHRLRHFTVIAGWIWNVHKPIIFNDSVALLSVKSKLRVFKVCLSVWIQPPAVDSFFYIPNSVTSVFVKEFKRIYDEWPNQNSLFWSKRLKISTKNNLEYCVAWKKIKNKKKSYHFWLNIIILYLFGLNEKTVKTRNHKEKKIRFIMK